ncbi:MAG: helix-turn-helix transcriptional regulator [Saprospiraceae bacterium]|nr:helix-turn-helix transcriptional regulator [Saprospiraceae bacterium]MCB9326356.1 helix-turn-helix transcriptional regulator [Lewinellaceae bacterium]
MQSKELLKGTLQTIVLKLLAENGRMYGYEITRHVRELTDGELELTEGALYPTLHKLEAEGFLVTEKESIGKRVRKYYSLTPSGAQVSNIKVQEFAEFVKMMQLILSPKKISPITG